MDDSAAATCTYIDQFVEGGDTGRDWQFWRNVMWLVDGTAHPQGDKRAGFWNDVAMTNFVQTTMADPRDKVAPGQIRQSVAAFAETLGELEPTHVLITSVRVWNEYSKGLGASEKLLLPSEGDDPHEHEMLALNVGDRGVRISCTYHPNPARRMHAAYWQEVTKAFFDLPAL